MIKGGILAVFLILSIVMMAIYADYSNSLFLNTQKYFIGKGNLSNKFNENEKNHLKDVKAVIEPIHYIWIITGLFSLLWAKSKKVRKDAGIFMLIFSGLGVIAGFFFNTSFSLFHKIFFASGTWLFPHESLILLVFPYEFFIISFICIIVANLIAGVILRFR